MGFTETNVLSDLPFLNTTFPSMTEKIEWSLPISTFSPGNTFVPLKAAKPNETKKEALKRELREELNINVNIDNIQEFEHNESNHTIENDGRQINLTLFIIKKW